MTELEAIRERHHKNIRLTLVDEKLQLAMDINALLVKIDADAKLLAQGREIVEAEVRYWDEVSGRNFGYNPEISETAQEHINTLNEWLKAVADETK